MKGNPGNFLELISAGLGGFTSQFPEVPNRRQMKKLNIKSKPSVWGRSLKHLPWDHDENLSHSQMLISTTIHEWYDSKHRKISIEEIKLFNSIEKTACPYCNSSKIRKNGLYKNGIQRYNCRSCNQNFSPITNTVFDSHKIPVSEWFEYLIHLFEFHSIKTSARDNRNAESTGRYWLFKVFEVLKNYQDKIVLSGKIYLDETYFPVEKSKEVLKDGKKLRGVSRNKIGVAVAFDEHGHYIMQVEYTSKPSDKSTWKALGTHIEPHSHLIHDGERSHGKLIRELELTSEVYTTSMTKEMKNEENPLYPINYIHGLAKRFMKSHGGYDRDNLQDWMNLICFILNKPSNRYEKIEKFIEMALNTHKRMKYRDVMAKKH